MKEGWDIKKLGEVCFITMGQSPNSESYNKLGDGLPFFQGCSDFGAIHPLVTTWCNQPNKIANPNDILMSVRAPIGTLNIADSKCCIGRGLAAFTQKEGVTINKFLYYFLLSSKGDLQSKGTGATFKAIGKELIKNYAIKLPSLSEQQHIVEELDLLSSIIEKKKAQLNELDNLAQSLFYDMFGDPITNEKGWERKTIGDIASFFNGKAHEKDIDDNGKYILINAKFISTVGEVLKRTNKQIFPLIKNDIVMVMSDLPNGKTLAKCYLVEEDNLYTLNQRICAFRGYPLVPRFLLFVLNRNKYFLDFDDGKSQTNLRKAEVMGCPIILPPHSLQEQFTAKIEAIEHQKELIKQSIKEVETLFNSRMDYYFN